MEKVKKMAIKQKLLTTSIITVLCNSFRAAILFPYIKMASDPLVDKEVEKEIDLGCSGESVFLKEESENLVKSATELDETDRVLPEEVCLPGSFLL